MTKYCNIRTNKEDRARRTEARRAAAQLVEAEAEARRAFYRGLCEGACGGSDAGSRDDADGSADGVGGKHGSQAADIPLFAQAWWLDAACPEAWTVLTYPEDGGAVGFGASAAGAASADTADGAAAEILAAMPVFTPYGNTVMMPPFTQTSYIWQNPDSQVKKHKILQGLAESLARYRYVYLQLSPGQWQAQPFYWRGLDLGVRYTYRLSDLGQWHAEGSQEAVMKHLRAGMGRDRKQRLHMAEVQGLEVKPCPVDEAVALCRQTLIERGERMDEAKTTYLKRLINITLERKQGLVWGGYDAEGRLLSTAFVVWQGRTAYYVAGGSVKTSPHAQTLVLFKAIVHCAEFCDIFDFEGSMIEGIAQFFQGFGSTPHPYLTLSGRRPGLCLRAWRKFLHLTGLCGKPPHNH